MSLASVTAQYLTDIANAIRAKLGVATTYKPSQMAGAIASIPTGGGATLQTKTKTYTPTESQITEAVTPDAGYDGMDKVNVTVNAISSTYVGSGVTRKAAATYYPSASDQSVNESQYLTGAQTFKAVMVTNLLASIIKEGEVVQVGDDADLDRITSVTGTYAGGGPAILATKSLGTISTSSTSAADTGQTVSVTGVNDYDLLIVKTYVGTPTNNRHLGTSQLIWLTGSSNISTKNGNAIATATHNEKRSSSGVTSSRSTTTKYGIYVNSATLSSGTLTLTMYQRYNSTYTGTINGSYTTKVYGLKLSDLN